MRRLMISGLVMALLFGLGAVGSRAVIAVVGSSMSPSVPGGAVVVVVPRGRLWPRMGRGDVVILDAPWAGTSVAIKRIVGLGGDCVNTYDQTVVGTPGPCLPVVEGRVFVVGDNRRNSSDSRQHGQVAEAAARARAVWILWPFAAFGKV